MAKKDKPEVGEQLDLIDVHPEQAKKIIKVARAYKKAQSERIEFLNVEKKKKQELLDLVKQENLTPLEDGIIKFEVDGAKICVTPRDELIQVKFKDEE